MRALINPIRYNVRMNIFFVFRASREKLWRDYVTNKAPSTFFYGLPELKELGHQAHFSDLAWSRSNLLRLLFQPLERCFQFMLNYPIGFQLHQALVLWPKIRHVDVIITAQDSAGLPFLFFKSIGFLKPKVVYISGSIVSAIVTAHNQFLIAYLKHLLKKADALICYSDRERQELEKFAERKVISLPLGVDTNFFSPATRRSQPTIDVLAAGRDSYRDYATLFAAVTDTIWRVIVACSPDNISGITPPPNVEVLFDVTPVEMKHLYEQAKLVVVPMKPTVRTQGQIVFMEAMAMGKRIIASRVAGLTTAPNLRNYPFATFIEPEDSRVLKTAISRVLKRNLMWILPNVRTRESISATNSARYLSQIVQQMVKTPEIPS